MKIPKFMYGTLKEVKSESAKVATKVAKGISIESIVGDNYLDTDDYDCALIINGPSLSGIEKHFHIYPFLLAVWDKGVKPIRYDEGRLIVPSKDPMLFDKIFQDLIKSSWGVLALMSGSNSRLQLIFDDKNKQIPFLNGALKYWQELNNQGKRYSRSLDKTLWDETGNLIKILAHMGVPQQTLLSPLPDNSLEKLLDQCGLLSKIHES